MLGVKSEVEGAGQRKPLSKMPHTEEVRAFLLRQDVNTTEVAGHVYGMGWDGGDVFAWTWQLRPASDIISKDLLVRQIPS